MQKSKSFVIILFYLTLIQGCAASIYIGDLAKDHTVFNEPHAIDAVYIASCGNNNEEYLIVNLKGLYAKTDSSEKYSLLVKKSFLQQNKTVLLDDEVILTRELTNCTKRYELDYKIRIQEYCARAPNYTVKELTPSISPPVKYETLAGEFGICNGNTTGNNVLYYKDVEGDQTIFSTLDLKSSVHSYPALNILLPITNKVRL